MKHNEAQNPLVEQTVVSNGDAAQSIFEDSRRIKRAFDLGVRDALVEHKRLGNSVVEWRDGKAVLVPADEINPNAALGKI